MNEGVASGEPGQRELSVCPFLILDLKGRRQRTWVYTFFFQFHFISLKKRIRSKYAECDHL